jgi:CheY-like chemotaxis protein
MGDLNRVESPIRVLVIEDNEDDRELLQRQLRKSGMDQHVRFISDGREALDFLTGPHAPSLTQSLIAVLLSVAWICCAGCDRATN